LRGVAVSAPVDLFVRPEQLRITEPGGACAGSGTLVARVYQGGHLDVHIQREDSTGDRLLVRLSEPEASKCPPIGARIGVSVSTAEGIAFAVV
jgi:putative spermidine/putrescine transport system ATP-binding protein